MIILASVVFSEELLKRLYRVLRRKVNGFGWYSSENVISKMSFVQRTSAYLWGIAAHACQADHGPSRPTNSDRIHGIIVPG